MGKRNKQIKAKVAFSDDEYDSVGNCSTSKPVYQSVEDQIFALELLTDKLFQKRVSTRETALSSIVDSLKNNVQQRFANNKCITLLHRCLNSIKRGSAKEIRLASNAIGLLSVTVGCTDDLAHEILEDSLSLLSQTLQSASEPSTIASLLDCLAIITYVGGKNLEETERSMQIIWQFIHSKSDTQVVASEPSSQVLTAAISAWSFLLAMMNGWSINSKLWRESMSYFLGLLDNDDLSLRMAVGEALALIFETGNLAKFFNKTKSLSLSSDPDESEGHVSIERLKGTIINKVKTLSVGITGVGSPEKGLIKSYKTLFHDILRVLKGCYSPETKIKIGVNMLTISAWSHLVQVNYLRRFLGGGFVKHAQGNELLRDFLEFTPSSRQLSRGKQHITSDEKVPVHYVFQPVVKKEDISQKKFSISVINKAKTQMMNKKRMLSQAENDGYYAVTLADE